jgi:hypothetical protein
MSQISVSGSGGGGGSAVLTIHGNTGIATPVAGVINLVTANITPIFAASGNTVTLDFGSSFGLGTGATASGSNSIGLGASSTSSGSSSIAIGQSSGASDRNSIAIGHAANCTIDNAICLGTSSSASNSGGIAIGNSAGTSGGINSIAIGVSATTLGASSIAIGAVSSCLNQDNISIGNSANSSSDYAIAIGSVCHALAAGAIAMGRLSSATGANSIAIGNSVTDGGVANSILIGNSSATSTHITGIFGSTVTGSAVLCDATGLLGTVVSSERYKENIQDWNEQDNKILRLSVKKFNYKSDATKTTQYGLIAEQVEKIMPNLVVYGKDNQLESVKYHELPIFLLDIIQSQDATIQDLLSRIEKLEAK